MFIFRRIPASKSHTRFFKSVANATSESTASKSVASVEDAASKTVENEPMLTRLKLYWKALYRDYKEVFTESVATIRRNPVKSSLYSVLAGSLFYGIKTNPDETMFRNDFLLCANKFILIGESVRNSETEEHLHLIEASSNSRVLRRLSLGIFSLIWLDDYSPELCVYKAICPHTGMDYFSFHNRVLDVGFLGRWWILEKKMVNYDVNPIEWPDDH